MSFDLVNERSSARYIGTLIDQAGALVPGSVLLTLTLTFYNKRTGTIINSRNAQNVLNAANVTVSDTLQTFTLADGSTVTGNLVWLLQPSDTIVVNARANPDDHVALFVATWPAGEITHEVPISINNVRMVS